MPFIHSSINVTIIFADSLLIFLSFQVHYSSDEENREGTCARNLHQAAGRGA